uniref:Aminoacyl tRNA synthase complex-interacting multifunctional protein 2 n=1 Tax=Hucho hucho TaxID=62062 RepID=A0A4W5NK95_9TELE
MAMYQVKPVFGDNIKIELPTCMYKLPNIHAQRSGCSEHALQVNSLNSPHKWTTSTLPISYSADAMVCFGCASQNLNYIFLYRVVPKLQMKFSIQNMCPIEGEANVARFLFRLVAPYPSDPALATLVDSWVDTAFFQLAEGSAKERSAVLRALNGALGRDPWLAGPELSLADIACYCCVLQTGPPAASPANVQRWLKACENLGHFGPVHLLLQ